MRTNVRLVWAAVAWLAGGAALGADAGAEGVDAPAPAAVATTESEALAAAAPGASAAPEASAAAPVAPVGKDAPAEAAARLAVAEPLPSAGSAPSIVPGTAGSDGYRLQPGDVLGVSVWKEPELTGEVLVRPDGGISLPLTGEIDAAGRTGEQVRSIISERLVKYIPNPAVAVSVKQALGNQIFVLGKVNRPGQFPMNRPMDVMQAISLAGGTTPFAALNDIHVLRREGQHETAIKFRYADVERGRNLAQNIVLMSGDTVVVP